MKPSNKKARARMASAGRTFTTFGVAAAVVGAITIVPPADAPPQRTAVPAVGLTAVSFPLAVQQQLQELRARAATPKPELNGSSVTPRIGASALPTPPSPPPVVSAQEFEDAIINTYHAIEPWVRYGFELATYAVGWVPWVGWLAPQIMIFYNFGERIVESLVVNSANWLWGPLPFGEGLANVARDSWNALVQLGRDEWNFWLPPLPPLPFTAEQTVDPAQGAIVGTVDEAAPTSTGRPHPVRDALLNLARSLPDAPHQAQRPRWFNRIVQQPTATDTESATTGDDAKDSTTPADSRDDSITPTDPEGSAPEPEKADDASPDDTHSADPADDTQHAGGASENAEKPSAGSGNSAHSPGFRSARDGDHRGLLNRRALRDSAGSTSD